ncbi:MAG: tRNA threonylcarbamoyladenosine dehydratase [Oscillospiraceae bacterium]|nr:tRNA threonylcarbamoyladenosine dehydratase [Oscillospiraceae bacterium]
MDTQFSRTALLLGQDAMEHLRRCRVAVFGLGGVGGWAAEALCRSGIGALDLIDDDCVSSGNINRQVLALHSTVGMRKTVAAAARLHDIAPACTLRTHDVFFLPSTASQFDFSVYDYVVDAIDTVTGKIELVLRSRTAGTPIISAMGTGNKLDPSALQVTDLYKTSVCPLARVMRKELRRRGVKELTVVYSTEPPLPHRMEAVADAGAHDATRRSIPGSTAFVPAAAGLLIASHIIQELTGIRAGGAQEG